MRVTISGGARVRFFCRRAARVEGGAGGAGKVEEFGVFWEGAG